MVDFEKGLNEVTWDFMRGTMFYLCVLQRAGELDLYSYSRAYSDVWRMEIIV